MVTEKVNVTVLTPSQVKTDAPSPIEVPGKSEQDHVDSVISNDFMSQVAERLPSEHCRAARDIIIQDGEWYHKYVDRFGDTKWTWKNIELLLGLSKKEMLVVREQIKAIALDLMPV
jgi:hypothetical protein